MGAEKEEKSMDELNACGGELRAAERALSQLRRKLETMTGWRATMALGTVERTRLTLDQGMGAARDLSAPPRNFKRRLRNGL
jgi:hypothetical protein